MRSLEEVIKQTEKHASSDYAKGKYYFEEVLFYLKWFREIEKEKRDEVKKDI